MQNNRNTNLCRAKQVKNDEYYTLLEDIEKEMQVYLNYDPDVLRGKTVLCPCDDPDWSNFTHYFTHNFHRLGLKRLISTCIAANGDRHGKVLIMDAHGVQRGELQGTGDFHSEEIRGYRDQADVIVTNPPFSLLRAFVLWIMEAGKQFLIVGNLNTIVSSPVIFPYILRNEIRLGKTFNGKAVRFRSPYSEDAIKIGNCCWVTNLPRLNNPPMRLNTTSSKNLQHYDNIDAVEVPTVKSIPSDYQGAMGVPITFLYQYSPDQFELLSSQWHCLLNGRNVYQRLIIRRRPATSNN